MEIRRYKSVDLRQISRLFYETVHAVNIKDYTKEQINAWATGRIDLKEWDASFQRHITYVVTENDLVVEPDIWTNCLSIRIFKAEA